jgi:hypothetical protein
VENVEEFEKTIEGLKELVKSTNREQNIAAVIEKLPSAVNNMRMSEVRVINKILEPIFGAFFKTNAAFLPSEGAPYLGEMASIHKLDMLQPGKRIDGSNGSVYVLDSTRYAELFAELCAQIASVIKSLNIVAPDNKVLVASASLNNESAAQMLGAVVKAATTGNAKLVGGLVDEGNNAVVLSYSQTVIGTSLDVSELKLTHVVNRITAPRTRLEHILFKTIKRWYVMYSLRPQAPIYVANSAGTITYSKVGS